MYHKDRFHVPCFAASVHFFRGHRQITDAHDWIVEQQDADHFQLATIVVQKIIVSKKSIIVKKKQKNQALFQKNQALFKKLPFHPKQQHSTTAAFLLSPKGHCRRAHRDEVPASNGRPWGYYRHTAAFVVGVNTVLTFVKQPHRRHTRAMFKRVQFVFVQQQRV